jgi:phage gp36-like protein
MAVVFCHRACFVAGPGRFHIMPYITCQQIYGQIPQPKVNDALDDDSDGVADKGSLEQIISDAGAAVDGFLSGRYRTPFGAPYPAIVVQAALAFACEAIARRREATENQNPFTPRANIYRGTPSAPGLLMKIANRELPLDVSEVEAITPGAVIHEEAPVNASFR